MQNAIKSLFALQKDNFQSGATQGAGFRKQALDTLKTVVKKYEDEILEALALDLDKNPKEAYFSEITQIYEEIKVAKKWVKTYAKAHRVKTPFSHFGGKSMVYYEPYGVVLIISPWNYPISLSLIPLIGAIAAGNCVILKPSEFSLNSTKVLQKIVNECFETSFVEVVCGDKDVASILLQERFDYIFFTGSVEVGRIVMQEASKNLIPVTLELGGKNPCILEDFNDLSLATKRIAWGKFLNAGQTCIAPDFLLINNQIAAKAIDSLKANITRLYAHEYRGANKQIAEAILQSSDYGKIISKRHFNRAWGLLEDAVSKNKGDIIFGGMKDEKKQRISPTLIDLGHVSQIVEGYDNLDSTVKKACRIKKDIASLRLLQEEIFAPILLVIRYDSLQECIDFIRYFEKPLALYLFSQDAKKQKMIIDSLSFGGGCVNDCIMHVANKYLPFGGVGNSGMGAYHGKYSARTFCREKSIYFSPNFDLPLRYPPSNKRYFGLSDLKIARWLFG